MDGTYASGVGAIFIGLANLLLLIIFTIALGLLCDMLAPLRDCQE